MRSSIVSRRVLGLAAAGVLGLSTLAMPGIALADDGDTPPSTVVETSPQTTAPSSDQTTAPSADQTPQVLAAAPAAPFLNDYPEGTDGGLRVNFVDQSVAPDAATSFEFTIDNETTWTALADVQVIGNRTYGTVTGLTNGSSYTIKVRASNSSGHSGASGSITATAYKPVGAPSNVVATRSATGVTVTWADPAVAGTYPIAAFGVSYGMAGAQSGGPACEVDPTVHTCTFTLPTGEDYGITVLAIDDHGNAGARARLQSGAVAAPAAPTAVPTKDDGDLKGPAGPISTLVAGKQIVLQGDGYLAGSSVRLSIFSTPVDLGTAVVASDGTFSATVTVPANLPDGTHHLVATGVDRDGNPRNLVITVTVSGGVATLAVTGFDAVPMAVGGGLVVLAGAGLVLGGRRRKA